ncbi:MAG TPA: hypothetical protein VE631_01360 [Alphaproteobacteria bacterium]|nr:hypothetical protein [Alphaproteobacteria bacterium]
MRIAAILLGFGLALAGAGCVSPQISTETTRFHSFAGGPPADNSVAVYAGEDAKAGSLEFATYAKAVEQRLRTAGFRPVPADSHPRFDAVLDYSVSGPQVSSYSEPVYGQVGGGYIARDGSVYVPPSYGVVDVYNREITRFSRRLSLAIYDKGPSHRGKGQRVFEGTVISIGSEGSFAAVADCLIQAMFDGFPGASGAVVRRDYPVESCAR